MKPRFISHGGSVLVLAGVLAAGCGGGDSNARESAQGAAAPVAQLGPNVVSYWDELATNTINVAPAASGSAAEQVPIIGTDMATVHVAIYDAAIAIAGTHKPYKVTPKTNAAGASTDAAVNAAAYGVLKGLFPNRAADRVVGGLVQAGYQSAYDAALAAIPDGPAKTQGIALGAEVAGAILDVRGDDGRLLQLTLPPYVPGTEPGQFRGINPVGRVTPYVKPFTLKSAGQFRADGPPALDSATYAADVNETRADGAANSTVRSLEQTESARFHTEPPPRFWPRNLRQFATSQPSVAQNARLMALLWVTFADAGTGCFESKYHYQFWRPISAIRLADTDGNAGTLADPAWSAVVPTPNHPEYPAAHACALGSVGEALRAFHATKKIAFSFDSAATGISPEGMVHHFDSTDDLSNDSVARIWGGMHFRTSVVHGGVLGMKTAKWVAKHHFGPVD